MESRKQQKWTLLAELPNLSVVVAFRNEERAISNLLNGLSNVNYPEDRLEVVLVNDHSDDASFHIVTKYISVHSIQNFKLLSSPEGKTGKKAALEIGVKSASGDWILFTDADCEIHPNWPMQMMICQQNSQAEMVCGSVTIKARNWKEWLEATEFASLIAVGASGITFRKPSLCNGANFLIAKSAYEGAQRHRSDQDVASGDDVFLLHTLKKMGRKIAFCFVPYSEISISPSETWNQFVQQRIRWASKWKSGVSGGNQALAVLVWLFHVVFLGMIFGLLVTRNLSWALNLSVLKAAVETQFLELFLPPKSYSKNVQRILGGQFLYSFYVIYFGLKVLFSTEYTWKGRSIRY